MQMTAIIGAPVAIELGTLKVAAPTNEIIDSLVKLYGEQERENQSEEVCILSSHDNQS